jgi:hypothetical protein
MQKAANNKLIVRSELKTLVREVFGAEYDVESRYCDALNFKRMATDLPIQVLRVYRDEFETACYDHGYDGDSCYKILESAIIFGYWIGMTRCPHNELDQFFAYTRSEAFKETRMSLKRPSNFLGLLGSFTR